MNTMSPLLTAAYLHARGAAAYGVHLDAWAEWVMHEMPRTQEGGLQHITYSQENPEQLWDDTLMMSVLPLAKIGLDALVPCTSCVWPPETMPILVPCADTSGNPRPLALKRPAFVLPSFWR